MNLYNQAENEALGNELVILTDKWPDCDQERAIELQKAFNEFSSQGGWDRPEIQAWESRDGPIYLIKRDPERANHYTQATQAIDEEITRRETERRTAGR